MIKFLPSIRFKDLKLSFKFHPGNGGINDYFQFQTFACNFVGVTLRIFGVGFTLRLRIYEAKGEPK